MTYFSLATDACSTKPSYNVTNLQEGFGTDDDGNVFCLEILHCGTVNDNPCVPTNDCTSSDRPEEEYLHRSFYYYCYDGSVGFCDHDGPGCDESARTSDCAEDAVIEGDDDKRALIVSCDDTCTQYVKYRMYILDEDDTNCDNKNISDYAEDIWPINTCLDYSDTSNPAVYFECTDTSLTVLRWESNANKLSLSLFVTMSVFWFNCCFF